MGDGRAAGRFVGGPWDGDERPMPAGHRLVYVTHPGRECLRRGIHPAYRYAGDGLWEFAGYGVPGASGRFHPIKGA